MSEEDSMVGGALDAPVAAADLVDYQEGAIVSRTLLKVPAGSLTVFALDAGQAISEHSTPHEAVVHVLDGAAEVSVDGDVAVVEAGETIRLPADVPHALAASQRFKMLLTMLRSDSGD